MILHDVEKFCSLYHQCTSCWTDENGGCWCFESCKANEKGKTFDLDGFVTMLQQEKYKRVDSDAKAIWNKAIKKAILLIESNIVNG